MSTKILKKRARKIVNKQKNISATFVSTANQKRALNLETVKLKPTMSTPNPNYKCKNNNSITSLRNFIRKTVLKVPFFNSVKKSRNEREKPEENRKTTLISRNCYLPQFAIQNAQLSLPGLGNDISEEIQIPEKVPVCEVQMSGMKCFAKCHHQNVSFNDEYSRLSSSSDLSDIFIESQEENGKAPEVLFAKYPSENQQLAYNNSSPTESEFQKISKKLKYKKYGSVYSNLSYFKKSHSWLNNSFDSLKSDQTLSIPESLNSYNLKSSPNESFILTRDKEKVLPNPFSRKYYTNSNQKPVIINQSTQQNHSMLENPFLISNYEDDSNQDSFYNSNLSCSPSRYKFVTPSINFPNIEQKVSFYDKESKSKIKTDHLNDYLELSPKSYLKNSASGF